MLPILTLTATARLTPPITPSSVNAWARRSNRSLQETLVGGEVIRAFGRQRTFTARFRDTLRQTLTSFQTSTICSSAYSPAMAVLAAATTALLILLGTRCGLAHWGLSIATTNRYIEIDLAMKAKALKVCEISPGLSPDARPKSSPDLLAWLTSL